jgi:hypothetical protein
MQDENVSDRGKSVVLPRILVDTGSEYTWAPTSSLEKIGIAREKKDVLFVIANGQQVTRSVGFAIIRLDKHFTIDEVVFAKKGDFTSSRSEKPGRLEPNCRLPSQKTRRLRTLTGSVKAAPQFRKLL